MSFNLCSYQIITVTVIQPLFWTSTEKVDFSWQIEDGRNIQMVYQLLLENRKFLCHSIWHQRRNDLTRTWSAYWVYFSTNEKTILWTLWTLVSFSACVKVNDNLFLYIASCLSFEDKNIVYTTCSYNDTYKVRGYLLFYHTDGRHILYTKTKTGRRQHFLGSSRALINDITLI